MATTVLEHTHVAKRSTLVEWLTTVDHKRIGILYGASAFLFFLIGGLEALIIRAQLAPPAVPHEQPSPRGGSVPPSAPSLQAIGLSR